MSMRFAIPALLILSCMGCNRVGPAALRGGRKDYNIAIQQTSNEQMLLNLVRLKYRDAPFFLEVSSVATQFNFEAGAGASATIPDKNLPANNVWGGSAAVGYAEKPTVSYAPLQGDKFVKQVMEPASAETLMLLYQTGWSVERIFRMCVQRVNGVRYATGASGPTPAYEPEYKTFLHVCKLLRALQRDDALSILGDEKAGLLLGIARDAADSEEARELRKILSLEKPQENQGLRKRFDSDFYLLNVETRSLMGVMYLLSQGVQTPAEDARVGRVTVTRDKNGEVFDWGNVLGGFFAALADGSPAAGRYVSVRYRGHTFYIDDADLETKSTFSLLTQMFALQAGEIRMSGPALTLPVGQ
jgi:hypothetical protein